MLDQKWIGQMPRFFQDWKNFALRPGTIELNRGNNPLSDAMIQILEKDTGFPLPRNRKRIGIEPMPGIGNCLPARPGKASVFPHAGIIGVSPADMPVWRITAQAVYFQHDRTGYAAEDVRYGLLHDRPGPVGHRRKRR